MASDIARDDLLTQAAAAEKDVAALLAELIRLQSLAPCQPDEDRIGARLCELKALRESLAPRSREGDESLGEQGSVAEPAATEVGEECGEEGESSGTALVSDVDAVLESIRVPQTFGACDDEESARFFSDVLAEITRLESALPLARQFAGLCDALREQQAALDLILDRLDAADVNEDKLEGVQNSCNGWETAEFEATRLCARLRDDADTFAARCGEALKAAQRRAEMREQHRSLQEEGQAAASRELDARGGCDADADSPLESHLQQP